MVGVLGGVGLAKQLACLLECGALGLGVLDSFLAVQASNTTVYVLVFVEQYLYMHCVFGVGCIQTALGQEQGQAPLLRRPGPACVIVSRTLWDGVTHTVVLSLCYCPAICPAAPTGSGSVLSRELLHPLTCAQAPALCS
jgi:hypothetical protein